MDPIGRHASPRSLASVETPEPAVAQPVAPGAAHERWIVQSAEHEGRSAALERWILEGLQQGGEGTRVVFEAKVLGGRSVLLGASGKLEIEKEAEGYRVTTQGGIAVKASSHGGAWKAEVENGFTTGRGWQLSTAEGAAWVASLLLQGAVKDTPAELVLPGVPTLKARLETLDGQARFATLEFELGAELKASGMGLKGTGGLGGPSAWLNGGHATRITLDRARGELVLETEIKASAGGGIRELQLGEFLEAGAMVEAASARISGTLQSRYPLTALQREQAAAGNVGALIAGLPATPSESSLAIRVQGHVGNQAFEAKADLPVSTPEEAKRTLQSVSMKDLPVRFARANVPLGVGAELGLGVAELGLKAKLEPRLPEGGAARPLGEWIRGMVAEVDGARADALGRLARAVSQPE